MKLSVIDLIVAARPNYMKVAPLYHALKRESWCDVRVVHTGQHYDKNMFDVFFADFDLPKPHLELGIGGGTHAEQTAGVMLAYEKHCLTTPPDWIVVVGDVNATLSCALVGAKLGIPVAHLEAGLRSNDRGMPEEINRIVTDSVANLLWTPSVDATENLINEGIAAERVELVGNIMLDCIELLRSRIEADIARESLGVKSGSYALVTIHRPSNVDNPVILEAIIDSLCEVADQLPLVFPVHPRTRRRIGNGSLYTRLTSHPNLIVIDPISYIPFMNLLFGAKAVITDSGGIQEETTYVGVPCLTLRDSTERPITVTSGTNRLLQPHELSTAIRSLRHTRDSVPRVIEFWDGKTATRVVDSLRRHLIKR